MATAVIVERGKEEEATKGGEGEEKEGVKWEKVEVNEEGRDDVAYTAMYSYMFLILRALYG